MDTFCLLFTTSSSRLFSLLRAALTAAAVAALAENGGRRTPRAEGRSSVAIAFDALAIPGPRQQCRDPLPDPLRCGRRFAIIPTLYMTAQRRTVPLSSRRARPPPARGRSQRSGGTTLIMAISATLSHGYRRAATPNTDDRVCVRKSSTVVFERDARFDPTAPLPSATRRLARSLRFCAPVLVPALPRHTCHFERALLV